MGVFTLANLKSRTKSGSRLAIVVFDIDGVIRDVSGSYRRAIADTVEHFTAGVYRPSSVEIDHLKSEGLWNNDWQASRELIYRHFQQQGQARSQVALDYDNLIAFFNARYRGADPNHWTGYICHEPLLLNPKYLEYLTSADILWGFFSGATRNEALYALSKRLGLPAPVLVAMEDAPGKPDPTGLLAVINQLQQQHQIEQLLPTIYVGDTVADMYTVKAAKTLHPDRTWVGVGVLPPHVQETAERRDAYQQTLKKAGAAQVFSNVEQITPAQIQQLV